MHWFLNKTEQHKYGKKLKYGKIGRNLLAVPLCLLFAVPALGQNSASDISINKLSAGGAGGVSTLLSTFAGKAMPAPN